MIIQAEEQQPNAPSSSPQIEDMKVDHLVWLCEEDSQDFMQEIDILHSQTCNVHIKFDGFVTG